MAYIIIFLLAIYTEKYIFRYVNERKNDYLKPFVSSCAFGRVQACLFGACNA